MKHLTIILTAALGLAACSGPDATSDIEVNEQTVPLEGPKTPVAAMDGAVTITVQNLVEETEPDNCLLMMRVANGTDASVSAGLFAFDLAGGGETTGANMFPQTAAPGGTALAQVILPGRNCDVAETISGGQVQCRTNPGSDTPGSCIDDVVFKDGEVDFDIDE